MIQGLPAGWTVRDVPLEAVGDDFAQVGGEWLEGVRVAQHLSQAGRIWAFAVPTQEDVHALAAKMPLDPDERVIGIAPGAHPDWGKKDREAIIRMLGTDVPEDATVGLLVALGMPLCNCPLRATGGDSCPPGCTACDGTNETDRALYAREQPTNGSDNPQ